MYISPESWRNFSTLVSYKIAPNSVNIARRYKLPVWESHERIMAYFDDEGLMRIRIETQDHCATILLELDHAIAFRDILSREIEKRHVAVDH